MIGGTRIVYVAVALSTATGCFTADLDPDLQGVFACEVADDCPGEQSCINRVCEAGDPPMMAILAPEDEQRFTLEGDTPPPTRMVSVNVQGTLQLTDPAANDEHVFGEGSVAIIVDGTEVQRLTSGPLSGGILFDVPIDNVPGAHRIAARAMRNDGKSYDNEGAVATRLFWIDDTEPHVAVKGPWPGTEFGLEPVSVEVEVTAINFTIVDPGDVNADATGHAHVHYDDAFPACPEESRYEGTCESECCDDQQLAVVGAPGVAPVTLPAASESTGTLTAILRNVDHSPYRHPFGTADGVFVFETISIERVER